MNFGKFFKLNRNISKIEEGFAIYDYMDLPAYFEPSEKNMMSPKYPVSVTITSNVVQFKLHYSAYKIGGEKSVYKYDLDYSEMDNFKSKSSIEIAHMEEVILELPFLGGEINKLSSSIKQIYSTAFPLNLKNISYGGRFLDQLLEKRYTDRIEEDNNEKALYKTMRETIDKYPSYSTLWLMGIFKNGRIDLVEEVEEKGEKNEYVMKFLRKLLLDFMFDLKHSDVFQNSAYYQKMYSCLMSDFYFSALMHKCEYYYYRHLTNQTIEDGGDDNKERVKWLYADELFKAEELWVKDIMSVEAEKNFEYKYSSEGRTLRNWIEINKFQQWPSWFAEPEEEMRRVCFTMKDQTGKYHICNSDVLVKYLELDAKGNDDTIKKMVKTRDTNKEMISRWFLMRYNFNAVFHLHFFKHFNALIIAFLFFPILLSLFTKWKLQSVYFWWTIILLVGLSSCFIYWIRKQKLYKITRVRALKRLLSRKISPLARTRRQIVLPKIKFTAFILLLFILCISLEEVLEEWSKDYTKFLIGLNKDLPSMILYFIIAVTLISSFSYLLKCKHLEARLHLLLPRLVASISLSWITLSMGFDLYVSYFDAPLQWTYILFISAIVLVFIMYEINRITPNSLTLRKFLRSIELLTVSYVISLIVGLVIINFLGEKYLERGGYISDYFTQYVDNPEYRKIHRYIGDEHVRKIKKIEGIDSTCVGYGKMILEKLNEDDNPENFSKKKVDELSNVYFTEMEKGDSEPKKKHPVVDKVSFMGADLFILRDFLIMFAFIAMFTGIFIQLIIFGDNKQMTEL